MSERSHIRHLPLSLIVGITATICVAGGAGAWWTWRALSPQAPVAEFPTLEIPQEPGTGAPTIPETSQNPTAPESPQNPQQTATAANGTVYWLKDTGTRIELVAAPLAAAPNRQSEQQRLTTAFATLLAGPQSNTTEVATSIPAGTQLLSLTRKTDGIHVDLSSEFTTGGGSTSMTGRLGQVIYTASMLDPNVPIWIAVDGQPLTLLGGEGLEVSQPITREQFETEFNP